jgi:membrane protease YdiL (CAAX protease family)
MSQIVDSTRSPSRPPRQPIGLLRAYLGLTFALAWAAWVPAAAFFSNTHRPGLPSFTGGLVILQTVGAAAPTLAAYLVLRVSGRRDLLGWIASRYQIWRVHPAWYLVAALLAPAITLLSLWGRALADPHFQIAPGSPLGEMLTDLGVGGVALVFPLLVLGWLPSSALLEEFGWRGLALPLLQGRRNALGSSVLLGLVWGVWHLPLMVASSDPLVPLPAADRPPDGADDLGGQQRPGQHAAGDAVPRQPRHRAHDHVGRFPIDGGDRADLAGGRGGRAAVRAA